MYKKPVILTNSDMAEGVYTASGGGCYTTSAYIHQRPETGRGDYRLQVNGVHNADHTKTAQVLRITFNQPVVFKSCNGNGASYQSGNGTNTLVIKLGYYQNPTDNIGIGDFVVESDPGLDVVDAVITD